MPDIKCNVICSRALIFKSASADSVVVGTISKGAIISCTPVAQDGNGITWCKIISVESDRTTDSNADKEDTDTEEEDTEEEETEEEEEEFNKSTIVGGYIQYVSRDGIPQLEIAKNEDGTDAEPTTEAESDEEDDEDNEDEEDETADPFTTDDNFTVSYSINNPTSSEYQANMEGLKITDIRGVLGCPHQFLPIADSRLDTNGTRPGSINSIGRVYSTKIINHMPLLLITPGVPSFLSSFSKEQKTIALRNLLGNTEDFDLKALVNDHKGKYYTLKYSYTSYFYYVNAMLRSAAVFLGIDNEEVYGQKLGTCQWLYRTIDPGGDSNADIFGHEGLSKFLGPYTGCIAFYADCGNSVDDSFSNSTTQSQLSSALNSLSDTGREMNFLVGNVGSTLGLTLNKLTGSEDLENNIGSVSGIIDKALGSGNILSGILNKCQTILAGGRMVFPEIWADSSFSRSYSCKMKLVSPSGDKLSVYLNILVPIYHILALTLPRQSIEQSYFSPFLVRAYSQGLFNVDMGIITDLNISKGNEGEWTKDGIPTVAEVSFTIKDLYDGMFMSPAEDIIDPKIMSNITELDYIANSCGININDQEIARYIKLYKALAFGRTKDFLQIDITGNIMQYFNQKANDIFGVF